MNDSTTLTRKQIQARSIAQSFSRGEKYYKDGAIRKINQRGETVEAICEGSSRSHYKVSATFRAGKLVKTTCTCEYDWSGDCKHIIALLLTILNNPITIKTLPSLSVLLEKRSKEDLISLIGKMVDRYPELMTLVEQPGIDEIIQNPTKFNLKAIRKQLKTIFDAYQIEEPDEYGYYDDYDEDGENLKDNEDASLLPVTDVALRLSEKGEWHKAVSIYQTILETFAEWVTDEFTDNGLTDDLQIVVEALGECLAQPALKDDAEARKAALESLVGVFLWDISYEMVDTGFNISEVLVKHIQREDTAFIRQLLTSYRKQKTSGYDWSQEMLEKLLSSLDKLDGVDPEVSLGRIRENKQYGLLIETLLAAGRTEDAIQVMQNDVSVSIDQIHALESFVKHGHSNYAIAFAETLSTKNSNPYLPHWLINFYRKTDNKPKLFEYEWTQFQAVVSSSGYERVRGLAQALGTWDSVQQRVIEMLRAKKQYQMLMHVYIVEKDWNGGWALLDELPAPSAQKAFFPEYDPHLGLDIDIAIASYRDRPQQAIPVLKKYVYMAINERNRSAYAQAAERLKLLQEVYDRQDDIDAWHLFLEGIRKEFPKLKALHDELNKAGF